MRTPAAVLMTLLLATGLASPLPAPEAPPGRQTPDEWHITQLEEVATNRYHPGDIFVEKGGILRVTYGGVLTIGQSYQPPRRLVVLGGGTLEVTNGAVLNAGRIEAGAGARLCVTEGGAVAAVGTLESSGAEVSILDGAVSVTGVPPEKGGGPGGNASLVLRCAPGLILRSKLSVAGGEGATGPEGGDGGHGGGGYWLIDNVSVGEAEVAVQGGSGGGAGTSMPTTGADGGSGGTGGACTVEIRESSLLFTTLSVIGGPGGNGYGGIRTGAGDGGNGGSGGNGGGVDMLWTGRGIETTGCSVALRGGNAGWGGAGGSGYDNGTDGGDGGPGGSGGSAVALINSSGPVRLTDSTFELRAGSGAAGGWYGSSGMGGVNGSAGKGGSGGSATCTLRLSENLTASRSGINVTAGNGDAGGVGSTGGRGGAGGPAGLTITTNSSGNARLDFQNGALSCRGGDGGDGGPGRTFGPTQGQAGEGGNGGEGALDISSERNLNISGSEISCEGGKGGKGGSAGKPAAPGTEGMPQLGLSTTCANLTDSRFPESVVHVDVDNGDYWRLTGTSWPGVFWDLTGNGLVEIYGYMTFLVVNLSRVPVTDGSATVHVDNMSKRTDGAGKADFPLLLLGMTEQEPQGHGRTYLAWAEDDYGRLSRNISVNLRSPRANTTLVLTDGSQSPTKDNIPSCKITRPDIRWTPAVSALDYLGVNGTTLPFIIEGEAQDNPQRTILDITHVEVRIGDNGTWAQANLSGTTQSNLWNWSFTWDILPWARSMQKEHPLGLIPAPIYVRCSNGEYWSDDLGFDENVSMENFTVWLVNVPPPLPRMWLKPLADLGFEGAQRKVQSGRSYLFEARILESFGTVITGWHWNVSSGSVEPRASNFTSSTVKITFSKPKNGDFALITCRYEDNESARRCELVKMGFPYNGFHYIFFPETGGWDMMMYVHVEPVPPPRPDATAAGSLALVIIAAVVLSAVGAWTLRRRRRV